MTDTSKIHIVTKEQAIGAQVLQALDGISSLLNAVNPCSWWHVQDLKFTVGAYIPELHLLELWFGPPRRTWPHGQSWKPKVLAQVILWSYPCKMPVALLQNFTTKRRSSKQKCQVQGRQHRSGALCLWVEIGTVGLLVMRRACSSQAVQDPGMKKESSMAITTHL